MEKLMYLLLGILFGTTVGYIWQQDRIINQDFMLQDKSGVIGLLDVQVAQKDKQIEELQEELYDVSLKMWSIEDGKDLREFVIDKPDVLKRRFRLYGRENNL